MSALYTMCANYSRNESPKKQNPRCQMSFAFPWTIRPPGGSGGGFVDRRIAQNNVHPSSSVS
eukprot:1084164-Prymnesium_polylepis.1